MNAIRLLANAKVNITLDITGRRTDGYHILDSIMHSVNLYDEVTLTPSAAFSISSNSRFMPTDERNVAYKAAKALADFCGRELFGVSVHIKKNIPTQAGLGGGSADAAAVLTGLNTLFSLGIPRAQLAEIGLAAGADVPFCIYGGAARVGGIGEQIQRLPAMKSGCFVIAMPRYGSSTREAFARYDTGEADIVHPDTQAAADALQHGDIARLASYAGNVFEQLGVGEETEKIKNMLLEHGAAGTALTGSGAAVYGLFTDHASAKLCRQSIAPQMHRCFVANPCATGVKRAEGLFSRKKHISQQPHSHLSEAAQSSNTDTHSRG